MGKQSFIRPKNHLNDHGNVMTTCVEVYTCAGTFRYLHAELRHALDSQRLLMRRCAAFSVNLAAGGKVNGTRLRAQRALVCVYPEAYGPYEDAIDCCR